MKQLNQKHSSVFYGWWIVGASFWIWLLTGGFISLGFTAFFEPIASEFGWSYTQVSLAASFRGVEVGLFAPIVGLLVDRWGPKRLMFGGILLVVFGMVFLSRIASLGMFYGGFILIALGMSCCSPTVVFTALAHWFRKRLGLATAIAGSGFALGGVLIPLVVKLIDVFGWRMTLFGLGLTILVFCLPFSLLFRHKPEQYGYLPDGEKSAITVPDQVLVPVETREVDIEVRQAVRSRSFWHIGLAMSFHYVSVVTLMIHVMPYLSSVGVLRSTAGMVAMAVPLLSIAGRLCSGWMADRFNKKRVAAIFFNLPVLGLLCLSYISSETMWILVPFVILFGFGWGSNNTLRTAMLREYFGRSRFGSIFGFMMGISALGGFIGPLFAGWVYDTWASYQIAWLTLAILVFASVIIIATTPSSNVASAETST
jgi:MFS family permease